MRRKPRDPVKGKLVTNKLISLTHGQVGIIEATGAMFVYFVIMAEQGFFPGRLIGLRTEWESAGINDLQDSFGQEWVSGYFFLFVLTEEYPRRIIKENSWNTLATLPTL